MVVQHFSEIIARNTQKGAEDGKNTEGNDFGISEGERQDHRPRSVYGVRDQAAWREDLGFEGSRTRNPDGEYHETE